jgi:hypothetical protein
MYEDEAALGEMESQIPERQPKVGPDGQMRLFSATEMGPLVPAAPAAPQQQTQEVPKGQRKLFDSRGRPVNQPKKAAAAPVAAPVVAPAPVAPAPAAVEAPKPKKPRKAKVKVKVGEQEAELEVADADQAVASLKKDIDKYEAFVACLRKK